MHSYLRLSSFPHCISNIFFVAIFIVMAGCATNSRAQLGPDKNLDADSINTTILPVLAYNSDLGLMGGAIYNRYNRKGDIEPFKYHWQASAIASTRGYVEFLAQYETVETGGLPLRSRINTEVLRIFEKHYFGIGNETSFSGDLWDSDHYFYELRKYKLAYKGRWPLVRKDEEKLDGLVLAGISYQKPYSRGDSTLFTLQQPQGSGGGWLNYIGTGLEYDSRNNENDPRSGNHLIVQAKSALSLLGSNYPHTDLKVDISNYLSFNLGFTWTLANRLLYRHSFGNIAFWQYPSLGTGDQMRGYPEDRFLGDAIVTHSIELRTWFLQLPLYKVRLGAQFFSDRGRVYTKSINEADLFEGIKQTVGAGGALSIGDPDFILRMDLGVSEDMYRIYAGIGYAF